MRRLPGLALGAAVALAVAVASTAELGPAAGGVGFLAAAEGAPEVVVGRVSGVGQIDLHGWRATLTVERALVGGRAPGSELTVAWEELGTKRPARFAEGARVALALGPLPAGSLWSTRFPKRDALAIAARGEAFVREPDAATLEPLAAWLALPAVERETAAGVAALAALAARGEAVVAESALARLDRVPSLADRCTGPAAESLAALLADFERPLDVRREALELVARRELRALDPAVEALAAVPSDLQGQAVDVLARLRGGMEPERTAELLADADPAVRAAAVRRGGLETLELRSLVTRDSSDAVRAAAAEALAARADPAAAEDLVTALRDRASPVRLAALEGLADLGPAALPPLQREIWEGDPRGGREAVSSAVLALGLLGQAGAEELARIAHEHPSERVRRLAELAMGRLPENH